MFMFFIFFKCICKNGNMCLFFMFLFSFKTLFIICFVNTKWSLYLYRTTMFVEQDLIYRNIESDASFFIFLATFIHGFEHNILV